MDTRACVIGSSQATRELRQDVELAAESSTSVLISGESGVGKKMLARRIHQRSARASRRFFVLECGRVRSAAELHVGLFQSDGGTLLLSAVSEMALVVQQELLTLLGTPENAKPIGPFADVRLIACAHPKIAQQMATHEFLEALYYRLNTMYLHIPPLRERPEDIPALVHYFLRQKAADAGRRCALNVSFDAMKRFVAYDWPGNLREIQQVAEVLASSDLVRSTIQAHSLPADLATLSSTGRDAKPVAPQTQTVPLRIDRPAAFERPSISVIEIKATDESLLEFASETIPNRQPSPAQSPATPVHIPVDNKDAGPEVPRRSSLLRSMLQRACTSAVAVSVASVTASGLARVRVKASWTSCIAEARRRAHQAERSGTHGLRAIVAVGRERALVAASRLSGALLERVRSSRALIRTSTTAVGLYANELVKKHRPQAERWLNRPPRFDAARTVTSPSFVLFGWGAVTGGLVVLAVTAGTPMLGVITSEDRLSGGATTAPAGGRVELVAMTGSRESPLPQVGVMAAVSRVNQGGSPEAGSPMPQRAGLRGTASFRGSLAVTSFPSGAQVRLNGRPAGRTPLTLRNLPVGSRAVRLELDKYQPWSSAIQVVTNQRTIVMANLRRTVAR